MLNHAASIAIGNLSLAARLPRAWDASAWAPVTERIEVKIDGATRPALVFDTRKPVSLRESGGDLCRVIASTDDHPDRWSCLCQAGWDIRSVIDDALIMLDDPDLGDAI